MKKRTLFTAGLLAASMTQAAQTAAEYIEANTGLNQIGTKTLCLKVDALSISNMGPNGVATAVVGLRIDTEANMYDILVQPSSKTKECETGYVKITTTAPLMSVRNAPVGL